MNTFMSKLKENTNFTRTENGAVTHKSTNNGLYDMFALGGAMRKRNEQDIIDLFDEAWQEDQTYALKCLFYLRDIIEGQGERRFFRTVLAHLAAVDPETVTKLMPLIPEYGRWDDLYAFVGTSVQPEAFKLIKHQLALDLELDHPSLLAKWLKSENTSSAESRRLAKMTRTYLGITSRQYRKILSDLRKKINVLERTMSANNWDNIDYDKIPSVAGLRYAKAFARHDITRYKEFMTSDKTEVNAKTLYPYEVVENVLKNCSWEGHYYGSDTDRAALNKYWDNLKDYFNGATLNGICVVDTSGSMHGRPMAVATSLGLYCAERNKSAAFGNQYITFSREPRLVRLPISRDFCDRVAYIYSNCIVENTNIEAVFNLILHTIEDNSVKAEDIPKNIIIISDMEFDEARGAYDYQSDYYIPITTLMEDICTKWEDAGYQMPHLIFWNVNARQNNIPIVEKDGVTLVSGCSPVVFDMIMSNKTGIELMYDKLNSERYEPIHL